MSVDEERSGGAAPDADGGLGPDDGVLVADGLTSGSAA